MACLVLGLANPVKANVVWDWTAGGGAHRGQIVTTGTSLAAGSFTVLNVSFTTSSFMPLGSVAGGTYHMPIGAYSTTPPYTIVWNGSAVVSIDAAGNSGVNGLIVGDDATNLIALFGTDSYGSHQPADWEFLAPDFTFDRGSDLSLTPEPIPLPEIVVENSAHLGLADGGGQDFGGVYAGLDTSLTFTIKNIGTGDLTGLVVGIDDPSDFTLTEEPALVVSPNGSTTFTVLFAPTSSGIKTGELHIANNDENENPFDIHLTGAGNADCVVSAWSDWSPCCNGTQSRTRTVITPAVGGGATCPTLTETQSCTNPNPVETITWPIAGSTYPINSNVFFLATFTDSGGVTHTGTWTIGGASHPATITEPTSAHGGLATATHAFAAAGPYEVKLLLANSCGGADTASAVITVADPGAFPRTAVLDNFNRANGAVGTRWIDMTATFAIASNTLSQLGGQSYIEWNGAAFGPNQEVFVTLSAINALAPEHNLMLKTQGNSWANGHIEVSYDAAGNTVHVETFTPPTTWKPIGTIPGVTLVAGDQFGARALSDGTVQVYRNGAMIGSFSVTGWAYAALGGRIGLSAYNATLSRFDNFGGGDVPPSPLLGAPLPPSGAPRSLSLSSAFPNPTTGRIGLSLTLPKDAEVSLSILDIQGREMWSAPVQHYGAGNWPLAWDGRTPNGSAHPGVYLARVRVGEQIFLRRIAVVR